jgi:hypothetical protein
MWGLYFDPHMATSPHLNRQLHQTLGDDAADDLVKRLDVMDTLLADVRELRHEMQLGFARMDAQFKNVDAEFRNVRAEFSGAIERGLREQTRFFFLAWSVLLAAIVGLYAR